MTNVTVRVGDYVMVPRMRMTAELPSGGDMSVEYTDVMACVKEVQDGIPTDILVMLSADTKVQCSSSTRSCR